MSRDKIFKEIEDSLGLVPSMFKTIPDSVLEYEWGIFKKIQLEEGNIPLKYRELMGLAASAATKCSYCTLFHTEMARLHGANDAEIEETLRYVKNSSGWSSYINGLQIDHEVFKAEIQKACAYVRSKSLVKAA